MHIEGESYNHEIRMCILANDGDLKNTKIYVGQQQSRQLVVYGMTIDTLGENALILPVPAKAEDVEMVDLSGSRDLFEKIEGHFPQYLSRGTFSAPEIEVQEVGDFKVSVIPSKEDFDRVSPTLRVSRGTLDVLAEMYGPGYCYIVALLKEGGEVHPLGYTHPLQANGRLHIPTLHYHKGEDVPEWDHNIYINKRILKSDVPLHTQRGGYGHFVVGYSERPLAVKALGVPESLEPFFMGAATTRLRVSGSVTNMDLDL